MANEITEKIRAAVWYEPQPAMNETQYSGEWRRRNNAWEWQRGKVRLTRTASGNIYLHGNTGSGMAGTNAALFDFLANEWHADTADTVRRLCELYHIELELTQEQREQWRRRKVAAAVAPVFVKAAQTETQAAGVEYLKKRGFSADTGVFGLLTPQSIEEAKKAAQSANINGLTAETLEADFSALGLTAQRAQSHPVVIPNSTDGNVNGFCFRKVEQGGESPKYLFSQGIERGAYCERLTDGGRVVIVEGQLDALRLRMLGAGDVVAVGGATPGDKLLELLRRHNKTDVVYLPDIEYKDGKRKTELERRAVGRLRTMSDTESGYFVACVRVAHFPIEPGADLSDYKMDADLWGRSATPDDLRRLLDGAEMWFFNELHYIEEAAHAANNRGETINGAEIQQRVREIYANIPDVFQRGLLRRYIEEGRGFYGVFGIDKEALEQLEETTRAKSLATEIQTGAANLERAAESGDVERMAAAAAAINETLNRGRGTRAEWDEQLAQSWEQAAEMVANQPEPIKTKWALGRDNSNEYGREWKKYGQVDLWADDITVFCAPTSHGKTMVLFQTALDLVRADIEAGRVRKYLYISREEQPRQLILRALNVWLKPGTLKPGTRRAALRDALRGVCPAGYSEQEFLFLRAAIDYYETNVFPRLALVHTDGSAESITANIDYCKNLFSRSGYELGGVFIDYFQLMTSDTPNRLRNYELKTICDLLKQAAGRAGVPFVIAAQLNREALRDGVDGVTLANIGEGADIERIAHDVYLVWQTDKTRKDTYIETNQSGKERFKNVAGARARRLFVQSLDNYTPRNGYLYVERLKAREGVTGLWALLPYDGESGQIYETEKDLVLL